MPEQRVIAYIDGFNLYNGLKQKGWGHFYWCDPHKLVQALVRPGQEIVRVKYFTAKVKDNRPKQIRQNTYLDALRIVSDCQVILGRFYRKPRSCRSCSSSWIDYEEKMTDSWISAHMVADAFLDAFDTAILVSGDTDMVPPIRLVRQHFPKKRIEVWFPPLRKNEAVSKHCDVDDRIVGDHLKAALLPDKIESEGVVIERPSEWVQVDPPSKRIVATRSTPYAAP